MPTDSPVPPARAPFAEDDFPLLRLIDRIRADEARIAEKVAMRRRLLHEETGLSGRALTDTLVTELVQDAKLRSATIGAGFALPWTLPLVGVWGSLFLTVLGAALWQTANEVELVYEIGHAYGTRLEPERLRLTAFWLVQLTNYDDLRERALSTGVRLTVRKLVQKLIAVGLTRAYGATAHSLAMARMMGRKPGEPWYIRATEYIGVPILFYFGWKSTGGVGRRAIAYFREEVGFEVLEGGVTVQPHVEVTSRGTARWPRQSRSGAARAPS
jgi:hypothetical protein